MRSPHGMAPKLDFLGERLSLYLLRCTGWDFPVPVADFWSSTFVRVRRALLDGANMTTTQ